MTKLSQQGVPQVPVTYRYLEFNQFVIVERSVQLADHAVTNTVAAHHDDGVEFVGDGAELFELTIFECACFRKI